MGKIALDLDRFMAVEQRLLAVRSEQSQSSGRWLMSIDLVGVALVLMLGGLLIRGTHLSTRILADSLSATRAAKESLEAEAAVRDERLGAAHSVMESTFNSMAEAVLVLDTKGGRHAVESGSAATARVPGGHEPRGFCGWSIISASPTGVTQLSAEERPSTIVLSANRSTARNWSFAR